MVSTKDIKFSSSSETVTRGSFSGKNSRAVNNFPSSDAYSETINHRRVFIEKFFAVNKSTLVGLLR